MNKNEFESFEKSLGFDVSLTEIEFVFEQIVKEISVEDVTHDQILNGLMNRFLPVVWLLILAMRDLARNPDHCMADSFVISVRRDESLVHITLLGKRGEFYNAHSGGATIDLANGCRLKVASARTAIRELTEIYEMINDESSIVGTVINTPKGSTVQVFDQ